MKNKLIILLILPFFILGCSDRNYSNKKKLSELTLSSAGAYLGYQFGDADIFTTLITSGTGFLLGSYIGDYLDQNDYYYYKNEAIFTLEKNKIGSSGYWKNFKSGNEGIIVVKSYFKSPQCRLLEHIYVVDNQPKNYFDTACREENGSWVIIR